MAKHNLSIFSYTKVKPSSFQNVLLMYLPLDRNLTDPSLWQYFFLLYLEAGGEPYISQGFCLNYLEMCFQIPPL